MIEVDDKGLINPDQVKAGMSLGLIDAITLRNALERLNTLQAQLDELAKQEPVGTFRKGLHFYAPSFHEDAVPLYLRAAPAVTLADLVPTDIPKDVYQLIYDECGGFVDNTANARTIWKACRTSILQNLGAAK